MVIRPPHRHLPYALHHPLWLPPSTYTIAHHSNHPAYCIINYMAAIGPIPFSGYPERVSGWTSAYHRDLIMTTSFPSPQATSSDVFPFYWPPLLLNSALVVLRMLNISPSTSLSVVYSIMYGMLGNLCRRFFVNVRYSSWPPLTSMVFCVFEFSGFIASFPLIFSSTTH